MKKKRWERKKKKDNPITRQNTTSGENICEKFEEDMTCLLLLHETFKDNKRVDKL